MTIQTKAFEQYFTVVMFIMLYKVVLTFESVDEIIKCEPGGYSYFFNFRSKTLHRRDQFSCK